MAKAAGAKKDDTVKIAVLVVVIAIGAVGFMRSMKPKSRAVNTTRPGAGAEGGPGGAPGGAPGGGAEGGASAITVTPASIPQLTPEIKQKIKSRITSEAYTYPMSRLEQGQNPFIPFNAVLPSAEEPGPGTGGPNPPGPRGPKWNRKMLFWGAFSPGPDESRRVIVEVVDDPQPWTGTAGETIDGTPYRVKSIAENGKSVKLEHVSNPKEAPVVLRFEGDRDETGKFNAEEGSGGGLFGGPGGKPGAPEGSGGASGAARGREPAYER
jgi:hypothetical protein